MTAAPAGLLAYALPAVPLAFLGLPLYVYLPAHYAALPQIGLAAVGAVLLLARLLDLVTDPLVGLFADRTRGRLRPQWLMLLGGGLMLAGAWWLFRPGPDAGGLYLFSALSVTYLGWTLLAIPYYALGAELGERRGGHTGVAAWREAGMIAGTLTALILPAVLDATHTLELSASALLWLTPPALVAIWLVRAGAAPAAVAGSASLLKMWRDTSHPAREVLAIHLLNALAGGTAATLFVLFARDVIGLDERASGLLLLVYFAAGLIALPLWAAVARRVGEAQTWRTAMLFAALGFVPAAFLGPGDHLAFLAVCVLTGVTLGADIAMPAALQARLVITESVALARPRGGALFGLWGMASKLALALAAGIALPLLALLSQPAIGFEQSAVIPWLYAGLPVVIKLFAILALQRSSLLAVRAGQDQAPKEIKAHACSATLCPDTGSGPARRV